MSELGRLLRQASQYLAGRAGLMLLGFLSFPVLTRILPVAQYGELALLLKIGVLWTVLSKCGLQNAALRFFPEQSKTSKNGKLSCASTLVLESALCSFAMVFLGLALVKLHIVELGAQVATIVPLLLTLVAIRSIQPTLSGLLRAEGRTWLFNICELSGRALGIGLSLAGLCLIAIDLHYYVAGLVLAEGSVVVAVLVWFRLNGLLSVRSFNSTFAINAWCFSAPLIAYELTSVVLDSGDRILIGHYLGLRELGLYSAAYSIATYAEEALMTPVNLALFPNYMRIWVEQGEEATSRFLSQALELFLMAAAAVLLLVYVTSSDLIAILASRKFSAAHTLLPVLVGGLLVYALHIFFNAPLLIHKQSIVLTGVTTGCCIANIAMNIVLLPRLGIMGAAVATLFSYVMLVVGLALVSRRYLRISLPINTLLCCTALVWLIHSVEKLVATPVPWLNLVLKVPTALIFYAAGLVVMRPRLRARLLAWLVPRLLLRGTLPAVEG
jgi:O-antigen/teichoic acid export membrane protein